MFAVIYQFKVIEGKESQFVDSWKELTQLIYKHEGSLGSRLHRQKNGEYIAYAQWPSENTWDTSGNKMPESADGIRKKMKESCSDIQTLFKLECVEDLLMRESR